MREDITKKGKHSMNKNFKITVWDRDCEKKQNQFLARISAGKIKMRQGTIVMSISGAIMFAAYIAGLYFTKEDAQLLTQIFCFCLAGLSLTFFLGGVLIKNKRLELEEKALKEYDRQHFYKSYEEGIITKIKSVQNHTVIYEIKNTNGNSYNWYFTVDKVEQANDIDSFIIHATDTVVRIEVPTARR